MDLFIHPKDRDQWTVGEELVGRGGRRYRLDDRINAGGNAVIHRCYENLTGEEYAVKFQLRLNRTRQDRFRQEVNVLRTIRHDHVARHRDDGFVIANGPRRNWRLQFLIMEMASKSLDEIIGEQPSIPYETYIAQFRGLARGLAALHARAIHRDIKPDNILLFGERWALSDLGLCHVANSNLTAQDELVGPRLWMSPEAVNKACGCNDAILKASDVFQLASVFWFVVTRRHPTGVVRREDYSGPEHLFDLFYRCLAHNHRLRPVDGDAFADELEEAIRGAGAATLPPSDAAPAERSADDSSVATLEDASPVSPAQEVVQEKKVRAPASSTATRQATSSTPSVGPAKKVEETKGSFQPKPRVSSSGKKA